MNRDQDPRRGGNVCAGSQARACSAPPRRAWWRRRTLVDLLERDISRSDDAGPEWPTVVEDAVLRQDMEWVLEVQPSVSLSGRDNSASVYCTLPRWDTSTP